MTFGGVPGFNRTFLDDILHGQIEAQVTILQESRGATLSRRHRQQRLCPGRFRRSVSSLKFLRLPRH